jgi:hypothetical protein
VATSVLPDVRPASGDSEQQREYRSGELPIRMIEEFIHHPYWYEGRGDSGAAKSFWDRDAWEEIFKRDAASGYNSVFYWVEPWVIHQWQTWFIRHRDYPEARELKPQQQEGVIEQLKWIFAKAHEFGLKNYVKHMCIVTTPSFARAHGMAEDMPVSDTVDWRHNLTHRAWGETFEKMWHFGVRNELTRAFTEATLAELFQTYDDLDGLMGELGEALPGKRSSWFHEAIVPGLKRSGRITSQ